MTKKIDEQNILKSEVDGKRFPKLAKATELANNYKIRAEKAEAESKEFKAKVEEATSKKAKEKETPIKQVETETPKNYSLQDIRALTDVHNDDVERVEKFARSEEISIAEALKTDDLKAVLESREGKRKTAEATSTGKGKRGTTKTTIKSITDKANKYEDLDSDEDYEKLAEARLKTKAKEH